MNRSVKKDKNTLSFGLFSGGSIRIERDTCLTCTTHACVRRCVSSTLEPVLMIERGIPVLSRADAKPETGWCIECLACELDCMLHGKRALTITFDDAPGDDRVDSR